MTIAGSTALAQNSPEIAYKNAINFYNGKSMPQSYQKAAELFRKAAEQAHAGAQFSLGGMYNNGEGVRQDTKTAYEWILRSAEQNYIPAVLAVGDVYMSGSLCQTVESDTDIGGGKVLSGRSCYKVPQVERDHSKAFEWFNRAPDSAYALYRIGEIHHLAASNLGETSRIYDAVKSYRLAAEKGDTEAQYSLYNILVSGQHGYPKDLSEAQTWDRRRREICNSYKARGIKIDKFGAELNNKFGAIDPEREDIISLNCDFIHIRKISDQ
jgi:TPR repeat protein